MAKEKQRIGIAAAALILGIALAGCDNSTSGGVSLNDGGDGSEQVQDLPSYEGSFVTSQTEAQTFQVAADVQIQQAITAALAHPVQQNILQARTAENQSGHYEYNGVVMDYTVTGSLTGDSYPYEYSIKEIVTINGTYGGYTINGKYDVNLSYKYTDASTFTIKYNYDCVYTVSYNGKGMKLIYTGNMDMTSSGSYVYDVHYAVYDNNNTRRYNFDYRFPE